MVLAAHAFDEQPFLVHELEREGFGKDEVGAFGNPMHFAHKVRHMAFGSLQVIRCREMPVDEIG